MAKTTSLRLIVIGGGGHATVLINALLLQGHVIVGFLDPDVTSTHVLGQPRLGDDSALDRFKPDEIQVVNGIGSVMSTVLRKRIYDRFHERGFRFAHVIHPSSVIAIDVAPEEGAQVMAGAVVQPRVRLGLNSIINTGATVDHDCEIGAHAHLAPGVVLSGCVRVGEGAHVGTGARVIQGISIGARSIVGAGAVVIRNVPDGVTVVGVPARVLTATKRR